MGDYLLKNGLDLNIRRGTVEDVIQLVSLIDKCAGQSDFLTFDSGEYVTNEIQRDIVMELSQDGNGLLLVAEIMGQLIGTLTFRRGKRPKVSHAGEFGLIIEQEHWGMRIGKFLIQELIQWANNIGVRKINLKVRDDNKRGRALYKALGFVEEGRLQRGLFSRGVFYDALLMGICIN